MIVKNHSACRIDEGEFCIDTLSLSFDLSILGNWIDRVGDFEDVAYTLSKDAFEEEADRFTIYRLVRNLVAKLFPKDTIDVEYELRGSRNYFKHCLYLKDKCGFIAFGGNNTHIDKEGNEIKSKERIQIYLTGEGCRRFSSFDYLYTKLVELEDYRPKITRIDIAYDDHQGARPLELAENLFDLGLFNGNGRPPKGRLIDDKGSGEGCTFYVGSKQAGKELCCYEKGKQLGDKTSNWVRWEGRLFSQDREIPLDALIDYQEYLIGMYEKALQWMGKVAKVVRTQRTKERIQYEHLVKHARTSYGALIHYMRKRGSDNDQIIADLINTEKLPARLAWTAHEYEHDSVPDYIPISESHPHLFHSVNQ